MHFRLKQPVLWTKHCFKEKTMPRANRTFLPGHIWHITHRCHQQEFLLKFARYRQCWLHWLFVQKNATAYVS